LFNLAGAVGFTIYGILFELYPVIVTNGLIILFNLIHLWRAGRYGASEVFHIIPISASTSVFLPQFVRYYKLDIRTHFPDFREDEIVNQRHLIVTRNVVPVGLFSYTLEQELTIRIHLDYVIPDYRDYRTAQYLFEEFGNMMVRKGYRRYHSISRNGAHQRYLQKMGFQRDTQHTDHFYKELNA